MDEGLDPPAPAAAAAGRGGAPGQPAVRAKVSRETLASSLGTRLVRGPDSLCFRSLQARPGGSGSGSAGAAGGSGGGAAAAKKKPSGPSRPSNIRGFSDLKGNEDDEDDDDEVHFPPTPSSVHFLPCATWVQLSAFSLGERPIAALNQPCDDIA